MALWLLRTNLKYNIKSEENFIHFAFTLQKNLIYFKTFPK